MRPIGIAMRMAPWKVSRSGNRDFPFEKLIIRLYFFIRDRPVDSDTILRMNPEIGRVQARSEASPMNRTAANPSAAVVRAKGEGILPPRYTQLVPIQIVGASFVAHPIALCIPEWTGFKSNNARSGASQSLQ